MKNLVPSRFGPKCIICFAKKNIFKRKIFQEITRLKRIEPKIAREAASKTQNTSKTENNSKTQNTFKTQNTQNLIQLCQFMSCMT